MTSSDYYHAFRSRLIARLGGACTDCGADAPLEFDHLHDDGLHAVGGWQQLYDIKRRLDRGQDDIRLRCPRCHRIRHGREPLEMPTYGVDFAIGGGHGANAGVYTTEGNTPASARSKGISADSSGLA